MELGSDGVFVGTDRRILKDMQRPLSRQLHFRDFGLFANLSKGLGTAMKDIDI
jgi:pyridoxal biosynthesis lyase PdxS